MEWPIYSFIKIRSLSACSGPSTVTGFEDANEWQEASLEIYYNNDAELIYDDLEELEWY